MVSGTRQPTVAVIGTRGYPSFYGGFETAIRRVAPALAERGWEVTVYGRKQGVRREAHADPRVRSVLTPGIESNALSTLSFGLTATLHALLSKPDVALVMNVANGYWLPLLKLRGIPTVVNVDGIEWERKKWGRLAKLVFLLGARLTARFADELVFDAEAIGDYWQRRFGRSGTFIPYGGDPREPLDLEADLKADRYALLVARFVPENTVGEFIDAAPEIIDRHDLDIVLVGSAPAGHPLQQAAAKLAAARSRVHHLGHISDDNRLFALWQHAGVYFHGHTVGGTNPALVQAMALGARVVARDTVYNREVLADAAVFCDGDPLSITEAVGEALVGEAPLRERALERSEEHYTWDLVIDRYEAALAARVKRRRRAA